MVQSRSERISIDYILTFETPFHCGTGTRTGLIDRTVVRDSEHYLYVPGSTLKGVIREKCEQLARLYELDSAVQATLSTPHVTANALQDLGPRQTMITRLFGSQMRPGRLYFDDAHQSDADKAEYDGQDPDDRQRLKKYQNLQVDVSTQVRLDRPTRTAVPGALYTSEFGAREMKVQGSIVGVVDCFPIESNIDAFFTSEPAPAGPATYSLLLLLAGLSLLERLGGNKSTGKGQCSCDIKKVMLDGKELKVERWHSWMEHLDALAFYTLVQEEEA
jgi:CRISPR/Cas system CSM-associated protein Csm3 (group 7 of RAMP superfamily)